MGHPNDEYTGGTTGQTQGPPIPQEIFPAELAGESEQGGSLSTGGSTAPDVVENDGQAGEKPVSDMNREELEAELGDDVPTEGSGANGNVVVDDLRDAVTKKREAA